jgi:hypothetical protein
MPTAIIIDKDVHIAHPESDGELFCGEEFSSESIEASISKVRYIDDFLADMRTRFESEEDDICQECFNSAVTHDGE